MPVVNVLTLWLTFGLIISMKSLGIMHEGDDDKPGAVGNQPFEYVFAACIFGMLASTPVTCVAVNIIAHAK